MCGIAGFVDPNRSVVEPESVLRRMAAELAHRGPDDEGYFSGDGVFLGHRRLSVIDLEHGHQPMTSEDGNVVLIANAEIYNFQELRTFLEGSGHRFASAADTEVLVHLWEELGVDMLARLVGMFAFALWDRRRRTLLLARDRMGEKPLYVHQDGQRLAFASELRGLMAHPWTPLEVDPRALRKYLLYDAVPAPATILAGVSKLEPAQWLRWRDGAVDRGYYWDIPFTASTPSPKDERELESSVWGVLRESVRGQLVADVPLGLFLSGGLDSSTIVALTSELLPRGQLSTFSIGFENPSFDESRQARLVAEHFGTRHHQEVLRPETMFELLPEILGSMSEPLADGSLVPTFLLARFARQHVTVALSGDGGDELLLGYPSFQAHGLSRLAERIPHLVRRRLLQPLVARLPVDTDNLSLDFRLKRFLTGLDYPAEERHFVWIGSLAPLQQPMVLSPGLLAETSDMDPFEDIARYRSRVRGRDVWDRLSYLYAKLYLQDDVLVKVDRASMAHGLEVRAPFLDHRVVELLASLPSNMKIRRWTTKRILRRLLRPKLPASIVVRPKKGFGMPVAEWLKGPLRSLAEETLSADRLRRDGLFDPAGVRALLDEHVEGRADHHKSLWSIVAFQLWKGRYLR